MNSRGHSLQCLLIVAVLAISANPARFCFAEEPSNGAAPTDAALARALTVVQKAAANYPKNRSCFSCHHQTLPMLAMVTAREQGVAIDEKLLQSQAEFTHKWFQAQIKNMKLGQGIGGRAMNVGYGLWALSLAQWKADDTTEAMVTYLLKTQKPDGHWEGQVARPPLEESFVTATVLSSAGIRKYGTTVQKPRVDAAIAKAKQWLKEASLKGQEDRVARLWGYYLLDGDADVLRSARKDVLAAQREDGGWSQTDELKSDAYATGQTLYLLRAVGLPSSDPAYQRGVQFLMKTQAKDGSWFVKTRSRPIQEYFDNGDPYGKDQFISTSATAWAMAALAAR